MTDYSPEHLATADLSPVSPSPVHPSSPILVPTLQDHVDTFYTMSLSEEEQSASEAPAPARGIYHLPEDAARGFLPGNQSYGLPAVPGTWESTLGGYTGSMYNAHTGHDSAARNDQTAKRKPPIATGPEKRAQAEKPSDEEGLDDRLQDQAVKKSDESIQNFETQVPSTHAAGGTGTTPHDCPPASASQSHPETSQAPNGETENASEPRPEGDVIPSRHHTAARPATGALFHDETSDRPDASNDGIDIQALVDNITARAAQSDPQQHDAPSLVVTNQASSLPPKPQVHSYAAGEDVHPYPQASSYPATMSAPSALPALPLSGYSNGAPGITSSLPSLPLPAVNAAPNYTTYMPQHDPEYTVASRMPQTPQQAHNSSQRYDDFIQDERKYVAEAKWDRFPEGSRLFVGNISSDRVSKREVFDIFSRFGNIAQISLKQAYGFVQYHSLSEGQAAMDVLQDTEIQGRKIRKLWDQ
ncbi:hypothetical protein F4778DRAFT_779284 [Xylariomycetidae sp. FL2044]|nr:hypothetical protein F4778DRAFT_779284 [Xylariomycetidae sp. FL2044]